MTTRTHSTTQRRPTTTLPHATGEDTTTTYQITQQGFQGSRVIRVGGNAAAFLAGNISGNCRWWCCHWLLGAIGKSSRDEALEVLDMQAQRVHAALHHGLSHHNLVGTRTRVGAVAGSCSFAPAGFVSECLRLRLAQGGQEPVCCSRCLFHR